MHKPFSFLFIFTFFSHFLFHVLPSFIFNTTITDTRNTSTLYTHNNTNKPVLEKLKLRCRLFFSFFFLFFCCYLVFFLYFFLFVCFFLFLFTSFSNIKCTIKNEIFFPYLNLQVHPNDIVIFRGQNFYVSIME